MQVTIENPMGRVPVSMILDDSCPVVNLSHYWIRLCRRAGRPTEAVAEEMPAEIPESFAREFGEWCGENGVKGKFSFVPMPGGLGTIDLGLPGYSKGKLDGWIRAAKEVIQPSFDFTPEMITHCKVVDLSDWMMTEEWEQFEWAEEPRPVEVLAPYIQAALQILHNVDIAAEGVTSPGAFARRALDAYGEATLQAQKAVNANPRPFFFCEVAEKRLPWPKLYSLNAEKGECCVGIVAGTGDWFAGWEGNNRKAIHSPDLCITEDLRGGRIPQLVAAGCPAVMVSHWPGFYFEGEKVGFNIFKTVVGRINQLPNVVWMKTSEMAHYWMARDMVTITPTEGGCSISSPIACPSFTLRLSPGQAGDWRVNRAPLHPVSDSLKLRPETWTEEDGDVLVCLDLGVGKTVVHRTE